MSFYQYNVHYPTQWSECHHENQYISSTQAPFLDYVETCDAAVVPTLSPGLQNIHDYHYHQNNSPNSDYYQETLQYCNQNYNHYYNQTNLRNTNYQPLIRKQKAAKNVIKITSSNQKGITKPKRHRTVFKIEQVEALEMFYKHKQFVTQKERQQLQEILQISDKTIKVWFQNRRLKDRKESKHNETIKDEITEDTDYSQICSRNIDDDDKNIIQEIDKLTEELQQKQDKYELDDFLLSVIRNPNEDKKIPDEDLSVKTQYYEPISPADSCEEKFVAELQTFDPKELLKTFLNFQE